MRLARLIKRYKTDPLSRYHGLRFQVRRNHRNLLRQISRRYGDKKLSKIKARTLLKWHAEWLDGTKYAGAHAFVKKLRAVLGFGLTVLEDGECARIRLVMSSMRFPAAPRRTQRITAGQANAVRKRAHRRGWHSIALAQALQFELMLRQKDVIGEWVPIREPGISDVVQDGEKWIFGLLWSEIDEDMILRHRTSKTGKGIVVDLKEAPMIREELKRLRAIPKQGPIIVNETTGLPFKSYEFRRKWRLVATEAGVPKVVFNMDSRAGAITEAFEAQADADFIRQTATHSDLAITQGYNRGDHLKKSSEVMRKRVESRGDARAG